jgi:gamma-glutamylcyclotransferase (GGCT)/AIG2-like uncharacterized protein YtfP
MDRPLFLYGTLRDPDLLAAVVGRAIDRRNVLAAVAPGHTTIHYDTRVYPALVPAPGRTAEGLLILGFSSRDLHLIDAFEGDEYRRAILPVIVEDELHEADVYLPTMHLGVKARAWSLEGWQQDHKHQVLVEDGAIMRMLRARLAAARLN